MTVFDLDQRRIIQPTDDDFTDFPFPAVAAIDTQIVDKNDGTIKANFTGSGITITPHHVLTAAHVVFDEETPNTMPLRVRATTSAEQKELVSRIIENPADANVQNTNIHFLANDFTKTNEEEDDIALLTTDQPLLPENEVIGLIAFVDPEDAQDLKIETAGYPEDNVSQPIFDHDGQPGSGKEGRDLVVAPGFNFDLGQVKLVQPPRLYFSNTDIDLWDGQSGSGVWHEYQDDEPRVIGLLNFDDPNVPDDGDELIELNGGVLFTTDLYIEIINQIEADLGTDNADLLPENLIIGSNSDVISPLTGGGNDNILGTYRRERIVGNSGDDLLSGEGASDRLEGNEGDDTLVGGSGDDLIDGGQDLSLPIIGQPGNDVAVFSASRSEYSIETVSGGLFSDDMTIVTHLNGGIDGTDTLTNIEFIQFADRTIPLPLDENDNPDEQINFTGGAGNDNLIGNNLNNIITGEAGNDRLEGRQGNDTISGGNNNDTLKGEDGNDSLSGGADIDLVLGGDDADELFGDAGNDTLFGDAGNDRIFGGSGNNYAAGGAGLDLLVGDIGNDSLFGGNDRDRLFAKEGNDSLYGQNGNDSLYGNAGADRLEGGNNSDRLGGGAGSDTLKGDGGNDFLSGGDSDDTLIGGDNNDNLYGENGNDVMYGSNGSDRLEGGNNSDRLFGGNGVDILKGDQGNDLLFGGNSNDTLIGGDNNDTLKGQNNNDRLFGDNGSDLLEGGNGIDTLTGGGGEDNFVWVNSNQGVDQITDFTVADDTLLLAAAGFSGITANSIVNPQMLTIGTNATTSTHRFIYSAGSGDLFYDSDGLGGNPQVQLAQLGANLALTSDNFAIIA